MNRKKTIWRIYFCACISHLSAKSLPNFINSIDTSLGFGYASGDTSYQIGNSITDYRGTRLRPDPLSELKFPLKTYMLNLDIEMQWLRYFKFSVNFGRNIRSTNGKVTDTDWGIAYINNFPGTSPSNKDIYSESDAQVDFMKVNPRIGAEFPVSESFFLQFGAGYTYSDYFARISNVYQTCMSQIVGFCSNPPIYTYQGPVGEYGVQYHFWYLDVGFKWQLFEALEFGGRFSYSPLTIGADNDQHLLRDFHLTANDKGTGIATLSWFKYDLNHLFFLRITGEYSTYSLTGTQTQSYYVTTTPPNYTATIDHKLSFSQLGTSLSIGYHLQ